MTAHDAGSRAGYHAVHLSENVARARVWQAIAAHLAPWVPAGAHVLEIGAGYCSWINAVTAARRVAVDRWPEMPAHAGSGVQPVVLDASTELRTLGTGQFDVVLASNILEHFDPDTAARVVTDVHAVLRFGGRVLIVQPNFRYAWRQYFDDYTHRSIFTHVSLANLLRASGFEIELVRPKFLPYSMRNRRLPAAAWLVRAYLASPVKPWAGQMLVIGRKG
jgi:SAM-dependent methyltransferase